MQIKLTFLGAVQNVTGSSYLLETDSTKFIVDCGMFQERELRWRNWHDFPFSPRSIQSVLLTHAHIDHCGLLPKLVRDGFRGNIYCTHATDEIARIMLLDSAKLQEEDAETKRKRHEREGRQGPYPEIPLYTTEDAEAVLPLLTPVGYGETVPVARGVEAVFHDAGHVLGSAIIEIKVNTNGIRRTIVFSGDIGRWNKPILPDPTLIPDADYVIIESTYGNTLHDTEEKVDETLANVINRTQKAGGNIVIPSFALERAQEVLYHLNRLFIQDRIPHIMVFVDSPMAASITEVFRHYPNLLNREVTDSFHRDGSPFDFPNLRLVRTVDESKTINYIKGTVVIIAGSGMCTGGRIKHHLVYNISRPESTILFVGYQAEGTLGRQIVEGAKEVRILGQKHRVRANIVTIGGFSAHADKDGLMRWLSGLKKPPLRIFVTHGEPRSARAFADTITRIKEWPTSLPEYQDQVDLG